MVLTKANSHLQTGIPGYDLKKISLFADSSARYKNIQPCIHFYEPSGLDVHSRYPENNAIPLNIYFPISLRWNWTYDHSNFDSVADLKFFDQSIIRKWKRSSKTNGSQVIVYTGEVAAETKLTIIEKEFAETQKFNIENSGETVLHLYLAAAPADEVPTTAIILQPGDEGEYTALQLGAKGNKFLMVYNPDKENMGDYVVEVG